MKDPYGHPVGTKEVTPPEIGIDELYKVDSPYKASLKKSYEEYKKSKDYKDSRLTETEYVQVMHQTRSFEYVSIDDEKSTTEMWRDLTLTAATVVLFVFCRFWQGLGYWPRAGWERESYEGFLCPA